MKWERRTAGMVGTACALITVAVAACGHEHSADTKGLRLDLDRKDPKSFISYYFGGLISREGADPFETGLVTELSGDYFLDTAALSSRIGSSEELRDANHDGTLDWDELAPFLQATYYDARGMPASFDSLHVTDRDRDDWFELSVDGVMTAARRRIRVPKAAIRSALTHYKAAGDELHYPAGTIFVADHVMDDEIVETTVMRRRGNGHWDFAVYDSTGMRIPATTTPPKPLTVPTQCAGCHLGSRLYEPEKSFPAPAGAGPEGPRKVYWNRPLPSSELVRYFDEHRKRSDGILGLYGTLYVADLQAKRAQGNISTDDAQLLESLGL